MFDNNSYVLILNADPELYQLHKKIVKEVRAFDKNQHLSNEMGKRYGLNNYNPHITISKYFVPTKSETDYAGWSMLISSYYLIKKKEGAWQEVSVFNLE